MAYQEYKVGGTYYAYDPQTGGGIAFPTLQSFVSFFGRQPNPTAPQLPISPSVFNSAPGQLVQSNQVTDPSRLPTPAPASVQPAPQPQSAPAPAPTPTPTPAAAPQTPAPTGVPPAGAPPAATVPGGAPAQPSGGYQEYQVNGTYYAYDASTGSGMAFPTLASFQQFFGGRTPNPNAPQLPVDPAPFNSAPLQMVQGTAAQSQTSSPSPTTPTSTGGNQYHTGNPTIDGILDQFYKFIQNNIAAGKAVNPNLTIDAGTIQQFIDQAHKEIDPYYATQLGAIKDDLIANLQDTSKNYALQVKQEATNFAQNLSAQREQQAGAGLAFSGVRGLAEEQLKSTEQATLDLDQLRAASSAAASARAAEQQVGTSGVSGLSFPSFQSFMADTSGEGSIVPGATTNYFTPGSGSSGTVIGTLPAQQTADINTRVSGLKSDYLTQRTYGNLTTP